MFSLKYFFLMFLALRSIGARHSKRDDRHAVRRGRLRLCPLTFINAANLFTLHLNTNGSVCFWLHRPAWRGAFCYCFAFCLHVCVDIISLVIIFNGIVGIRWKVNTDQTQPLQRRSPHKKRQTFLRIRFGSIRRSNNGVDHFRFFDAGSSSENLIIN